MASGASLTTLGNWSRGVDVGLRDVLDLSMDIMGRNGLEAARHAMILMAQSARAITPKAPARRPVSANARFRHLLRTREPGSTYREARQAGRDMSSYYKFTAEKPSAAGPVQLYGNTRESISKIRNRGLAKKSWMWGLSYLNATGAAPGIMSGIIVVEKFNSPARLGYQMHNNLSYIMMILPPGWESTVAQKAKNKIMAQARAKIEREFATRIARRDRAIGRSISSLFTGVA